MDLKLENICAPKTQCTGDLCTSDTLWPHPPQSLLFGLLDKVVLVAGTEDVCGLTLRDFTSPGLAWLPPLLPAHLSESRGHGGHPSREPGGHTACLTQHDSYPTSHSMTAIPPRCF